ncbi:hypothetical protein FC66_GL001444 [Dellaglioa algida DSM 15638]|uniref:Uncharacterized protein n=2 Tax=Dellaglioa algida TaxID=105612 RepID=A0A0R1HPA5_9LACO|nr:hypothetical protein FC66_GL001444 [Dellaglioa algida DSM 15638]
MTSREIAEVINSAIMQSTPVSIDLSTKNIDGTLLDPVTGLIAGWYEDNLIINDAKVNITDIHAIYFSSY